MAAVEPIGGFRNTLFDDGESGIGGIFQCHRQGLFLLGGKAGEDPVCQICVGIRLSAYTDLHPGEGLGAQLLNDGLDAVVTAGRTIRADPETAGFQRNIVKKDDDPLGRDIEVGAQLYHGKGE